MPEVFINYRTNDGDQAAATIALELNQRFGDGTAFRASESIKPSQSYPDSLLAGLHACGALLALIGPGWLEAPDRQHPGRRALENEDDWVRKEILGAFARGLPVIPVLLGRHMERLDASALPRPLARLAYAQSLRYDPQQAPTDLARIGDALTDLVPGLTEKERESSPLADGGVHNDAEINGGEGPFFQTRDVSGGITTTHIGNSTGPIHSGTGDQHNHHQSGGDGATFISGDNHGGVNHGGVNQDFGGSGRRKRDQS
ncbi:TIR domain-containing protein [Streptomyces marispadix]|uniref:TIR domain-containing protein n=1 Tax=Streptomyces marispadix TaxID=2922868 RepID=A0ABS9SSY0_9ACTN|nr:TIR domain-containing protein [Streptomyces marispadix]MCH6159156.1 TIR domain-containing protein [Streptomyces marispadix]